MLKLEGARKQRWHWRQVRVAVSAGRGGAGHEVAIPDVVGDGHTGAIEGGSLQVGSVFCSWVRGRSRAPVRLDT
jgi:hypothetical protein